GVEGVDQEMGRDGDGPPPGAGLPERQRQPPVRAGVRHCRWRDEHSRPAGVGQCPHRTGQREPVGRLLSGASRHHHGPGHPDLRHDQASITDKRHPFTIVDARRARQTAPYDAAMVVTTPNPIHGTSAPDASWSTVNLSEAVPGPVSPLGWSVWSPAGELGARVPFHAMGALPKAMVALPTRPDDRVLNVFFGRVALRVDFMCEIGDLVPGTSGEALGRQVFGLVPERFESHASKRRYPVIALKFPPAFVRVPSLIRRARAETGPWWETEVALTPQLDLPGARAQLRAGIDRFTANLSLQATAIVCGIQIVYEQLSLLAAKAGADPAALMSGHGSHAETAVIDDLWAVSRDRLALEGFVA